MKLRSRGDAGVPQGPHAVICKNTEVPGASKPMEVIVGYRSSRVEDPPPSMGWWWEESAAPGHILWRKLHRGANRSAPTGCTTTWCGSFPERSGGISASNTARRKPVGLWDPHRPSNSLLPLPSAARRYWGMGAKLGSSFIPQAIWLLNPHTNTLTARSPITTCK